MRQSGLRWGSLAAACAAVLALAACGEEPQTMETRKATAEPAWQGTSNGFQADGWKAGDQTSWDEQMKNRARGQNEYNRMSGA
jgi:hypothetical protein